MPRKSAEALATHTAAAAGKLTPSPGMSAAERRAWRAVVEACPAGHLSERDRPLLESFVALTVAQRTLTRAIAGADALALLTGHADALKRVEAIAKTLAGLSNRLKLAPLASHSAPHKAGQRGEAPQRPAPLLGGLARVK